MLSFHWKLYNTYCNFLNKIIFYEEKTTNNSEEEIQIVNIFESKYNERKEGIMNELTKVIKNKEKKNTKTESEVFSQNISGSGEIVKKKKKIDKHFLKTTLNTMYDNYFDMNKKEDNFTGVEVLRSTKNKMMNTMLRFTNNLVYDDINYKPYTYIKINPFNYILTRLQKKSKKKKPTSLKKDGKVNLSSKKIKLNESQNKGKLS